MKKIIITLAILTVSFTLFGQTDSLTVEEFVKLYEPLMSGYRENYESGNWKQTEKVLYESINLFNRQFVEHQGWNPQIISSLYYDLACVYSLQNQKKKALDAFEKSIESGYNNYRHTLTDSDLDNIRKEKRFISLLEKLKEFDKLVILQNAGAYQKENADSLPKFTYQSADASNLKYVKSYFKLDSIAGNDDEISKILNLMYWVHNNIRHDGENWALCEFDAIDLYNYYKATGKGINCRHLAIALNEMYLAIGLKSRYVTCMPKDSTDQDCHVINTVWVDSLQKWIWIDPTFAAYVKDDNGNFLGIGEVRERLIHNQPLVLNEDANWNNESKQTKANYLDNYMAKNLYWITCIAESRFNVESRYRSESSKYVNLLPLGFNAFGPVKNQIATHDPDYFWQKPE